MKTTIKLIVINFLLLSLPFSIFAQQIKNDKSDIKFLEERIDGNKENTKNQIKALDEKVNNQQKTLKDELVLRSESLEKAIESKYEFIKTLINVYVTGIGLIFSIIIGLLAFFGYRTIKGTVKKIIEPQAKIVIKRLLKDLEQEGKKSINDITVDLKKQFSGFDTSKPIPENARKILDEFDDMLTQKKTEREYLFDDWLYKGLFEYDKKNYPAAITYWSKALKLNPKNALGHYNRALAYDNLEQYERAIDDYNKAIELDPRYAAAYNNRGVSYGKHKKYKKAIEDFNKTIALDREYAPAYCNRGNAYGHLKEYKMAIKDYDEAIKLDPKYAIAYNNRGFLYNNLKQYERAIDDYNKAIELDPSYAIAYENLSETNIITGDYKGALKSVAKALSLSLKIKDEAMLLYFNCIAKKLLNMNTSECETTFNEIIKKEFTISWNFDTFESWLKEAKIQKETHTFIKDMTDSLKKHKE